MGPKKLALGSKSSELADSSSASLDKLWSFSLHFGYAAVALRLSLVGFSAQLKTACLSISPKRPSHPQQRHSSPTSNKIFLPFIFLLLHLNRLCFFARFLQAHRGCQLWFSDRQWRLLHFFFFFHCLF